jgi:hypothetical protein
MSKNIVLIDRAIRAALERARYGRWRWHQDEDGWSYGENIWEAGCSIDRSFKVWVDGRQCRLDELPSLPRHRQYRYNVAQ